MLPAGGTSAIAAGFVLPKSHGSEADVDKKPKGLLRAAPADNSALSMTFAYSRDCNDERNRNHEDQDAAACAK